MEVRKLLKQGIQKKYPRNLYEILRKKKRQWKFKQNITGKYKFINRSRHREKLCIVLAGYKPFLYDAVFGRLKKYIEKDIDVCVVSSGLYSEELEHICEENNWSYLSIKRNNVSLAQNIAIYLHKKAKYIYKVDEDIFITKNFFQTLFQTYMEVQKKGEYKVGFIAPLIPINGYGHLRILKKIGLVEKYKEKFEKPLFASGSERMIENNPEVAKFFWGEDNIIPSIDEMDELFHKQPLMYKACPIRFSIGAILFSREVFETMGMFTVGIRGNGMGLDEIEICSLAMRNSYAIIVSENTLVGHLSFGKQNETMRNYFEENKEKFL